MNQENNAYYLNDFLVFHLNLIEFLYSVLLRPYDYNFHCFV